MEHLAKRVLSAVLVGVATTVASKVTEWAWTNMNAPVLLRGMTLDIWYVWLGVVAAITFYLIARVREQRRMRSEKMRRWQEAVEMNITRVCNGAQMALIHVGNTEKWALKRLV